MGIGLNPRRPIAAAGRTAPTPQGKGLALATSPQDWKVGGVSTRSDDLAFSGVVPGVSGGHVRCSGGLGASRRSRTQYWRIILSRVRAGTTASRIPAFFSMTRMDALWCHIARYASRAIPIAAVVFVSASKVVRTAPPRRR